MNVERRHCVAHRCPDVQQTVVCSGGMFDLGDKARSRHAHAYFVHPWAFGR
ncbi:MAG: hypothetical protein HKL99_05745 [Burkholderiales bacterium]|jgi:hypothetical protein|nr:hypothetical protein [Burkholderiales bacterium]